MIAENKFKWQSSLKNVLTRVMSSKLKKKKGPFSITFSKTVSVVKMIILVALQQPTVLMNAMPPTSHSGMSIWYYTIVSYKHNTWQTHIWNRIHRNKVNDMPIPLPVTDIIKHKYDNETRQGNLTGEMTVNISAVFVL